MSTTMLEAAEMIAAEAARLRGQGIGLGPSNPDRVKMHLDVALDARKRSAGELGLAPAKCVCDPMDLAALGHMMSCPCFIDSNRYRKD